MEDFKKKVVMFMSHISYIEDMEINPSIFSGNLEDHDCDKCRHSKLNQGDTFDDAICKLCWGNAIMNYSSDK